MRGVCFAIAVETALFVALWLAVASGSWLAGAVFAALAAAVLWWVGGVGAEAVE